MYQTGDLIIYASTGVCRVEGIGTPEFAREKQGQLFYLLKPLYQDGMVYVPVDTKLFMRPVISEAQAQTLIDTIPTIRASAFYSTVQRELEQHYQQAINTNDCNDLLELTMSLHAKKEDLDLANRKMGAVDERFKKRAEDLLFGELGAALGMPRDQVQSYIQGRMERVGQPKS